MVGEHPVQHLPGMDHGRHDREYHGCFSLGSVLPAVDRPANLGGHFAGGWRRDCRGSSNHLSGHCLLARAGVGLCRHRRALPALPTVMVASYTAAVLVALLAVYSLVMRFRPQKA